MKFHLSAAGYALDAKTNVWSRPGYAGIAYSDGDEVEMRIADIVESTTDLSVLSGELRQHCTDWTTSYHLACARANILRPFEGDLRGDILEVGAGCGAITRYLGECGGNVLALEGSPRRAAIARSRTRDLPNVAVVSDRFDQLQCAQQFDVVTLIGVLEYANLFTAGDNPAANMLARIRSLLKPDGALLFAIENQLGLKYFAGSPEDHLGVPMYGLEGRYRCDQPKTYGRGVLQQLLTHAGFTRAEFMAPFPDYKFTVSIVTEAGFAAEDFDGCALAAQSVRRDLQLPPILAFSPELVWPILGQNGLALELANSFLIVAGMADRQVSASTYAWHFSTERSSRYCKQTSFVRAESGAIEVRYRLLAPDDVKSAEGKLLRFAVPDMAEYVRGKPLSQELTDIVSHDGWHMQEIGEFFRRYLHIVRSLVREEGGLSDPVSPSALLPGECFDCMPHNIIVDAEGGSRLIDREWVLVEPMSVRQLIFRAAFSQLTFISRLGACADAEIRSPLEWYRVCYGSLGVDATDGMLEELARQELAIHAEVSQFPVDGFDVRAWLNSSSLCRYTLSQAVFDQGEQIVRLNRSLVEREAQMASMLSSVSWRITKPLRNARAFLSKCGAW
ncbi:MAG: class I SAM-dependent methyltransferase [Nitrospira sp.]|nr:class I SAM-dependent methyltransferase [Nitrospira sp.]